MQLALTTQQAAWFLPFVAPLCLYVTWNDLRAMKIPTWSTDALALVFVVVGLFVMDSWSEYFWRYAHFGVILLVGMLLNAVGAMGAGDSKFIASAAPFVALDDAGKVLMILAACLLAGVLAHRIARITPLRRLAPDWQSWTEGKRFPMGFPLGVALIVYLAIPLI